MILIFNSIVPDVNYAFTDESLQVHAQKTVFIRRGQVIFATKNIQVCKIKPRVKYSVLLSKFMDLMLHTFRL